MAPMESQKRRFEASFCPTPQHFLRPILRSVPGHVCADSPVDRLQQITHLAALSPTHTAHRRRPDKTARSTAARRATIQFHRCHKALIRNRPAAAEHEDISGERDRDQVSCTNNGQTLQTLRMSV